MNLKHIIGSIHSLLLVVLLSNMGFAQFHEGFDSPETSWTRHQSDCIIPESKWIQRRTQDIKTENRIEKISFANGPGTQILLSHAVDPAFVIPELTPSIRLKATRAGIQLFARVVLPHTQSPNGDGPLTTMLAGPIYRSPGKWEELTFKTSDGDLQEKLHESVWILRRKFGDIDQREAFVDKLVLNVYTGPGASSLQIDDLKLQGIVSANEIANRVATEGSVVNKPEVVQAGFTQAQDKRKSLVTRDGTVLLVKRRPFFPRIIQHNGEPLDYLKAIGFNTVELKTTATPEQLQAAHNLDIWLICPAPTSVGLSPIGFSFDRVLAWSVGEQLTENDLPLLQRQVREIRESDRREGRPIIGNVHSNWSRLSKIVDVVSVGVEPIGSSFLASQYSDWIDVRRTSIGNSKPIWTDIQTQLSRSLLQQIGTLTRRKPPTPLEPQQIKFLIYEAIAGGSRGLRFLSRERLDGPDPASRLRAMTVQWANAQLEQLEPWAVGGALMGEISTEDSQLDVTAINTNRSRLLLIQRPTHHEQYLAGDVNLKTVSFRDTASPFADSVYMIGDAGLINLPNSRQHSGVQIQIEKCPYTAAVVMTQDPRVISNLKETYKRIGKQSVVQLREEMSRQWLAIIQLINEQVNSFSRGTIAASGALEEAANFLQTAQRLTTASSPELAVEYLNRTDERLAFVRRELITGPLGLFQSKSSTPFTTHCSLIPLHWELTQRLTTTQWNPNGLAGGDFENLQHMMANGWENRRLANQLFQTKVELTDSAAVAGRYGIKLTVESANRPAAVEATPLWIQTPEIPVKGGQMIRVHGWVNVPDVIAGTHEGLMIIDSLAGPEMAERIPVTQGWQEFTLYRGAASAGAISVKFSLEGVGEAMLDEVTIRTIDLPLPELREVRKTNQ